MTYLDSELKGFLRATTLMADNEFNDFLHTDLLKERNFTFTAIPFLIDFLKNCVQKDHFDFPPFEYEQNNSNPVVSRLFSSIAGEYENDTQSN